MSDGQTEACEVKQHQTFSVDTSRIDMTRRWQFRCHVDKEWQRVTLLKWLDDGKILVEYETGGVVARGELDPRNAEIRLETVAHEGWLTFRTRDEALLWVTNQGGGSIERMRWESRG